MTIQPVVEGHGEVEALPILLRRIAGELHGRHDIRILRPRRIPRDRFKPHTVVPYAEELAREIEVGTCILIVFDADDDCPLPYAGAFGTPENARLALADREFEAWILADTEDPAVLRRMGVKQDLKALVAERLGRPYRPVTDGPKLVATLDLARAQTNSRSFRHLVKVVRELVKAT